MQNRSIYLLIQLWNLLRVSLFLFQSRISYARHNFREDSESDHLEDREMTPRSCLDEDNEFRLLASRCETTSVQSLPQSVRLLQCQLKAERLASAQLRLEVKDVMKMSRDYLAHYGAIQLGIEHLLLTQLRSHQLVQLLAVPVPARPNAFWSALSFVYSFVGAFICTGGDLWCPVYVIRGHVALL